MLYFIAVTCETVDYVFLVDISGSVHAIDIDNWGYIVEFMVDFTEQITLGPLKGRVGVVTFGNNGVLQINLDDYSNKTLLQEAIRNLPFHRQPTNVASGLNTLVDESFLSDNGGRDAARDVAIMIYDGEPHNSKKFDDDPIAAAQSVHENGIDMYVLVLDYYFSIVNETDTSLVNEITNNEADHLYIIKEDFLPLSGLIDPLYTKIIEDCNENLLVEDMLSAGNVKLLILLSINFIR